MSHYQGRIRENSYHFLPFININTEASLGDVKIDDDDGGIVKIYYTDGSRGASWDGICVDYGSPSAIGRVICRQLGYLDVAEASVVAIDLQ